MRNNSRSTASLKQTKAPLSHIADRFIGTPLMIHPQKLDVIVQELGPRIFPQAYLPSLNEIVSELASHEILAGINLRSQATGKSYEVTESGIALIPVEGTLMKRSAGAPVSSGKVYTYEDISAQIAEAVDDPTVSAICLDIDSPGGETHGAFELADQIFQARSKKPIIAAANDLAASAAYLLGSSASKLYVTRTGAVGSIGVYSLMVDQSAMDAKLGVKFNYIYAGERKVDGNPHEPLSNSARAQAQTEIDRQYGLFVSAVARNRGLSAEQVVGTKALCFFADNAVPMLADKVGTLEDAVADLEANLGATRTSIPVSGFVATTGPLLPGTSATAALPGTYTLISVDKVNQADVNGSGSVTFQLVPTGVPSTLGPSTVPNLAAPSSVAPAAGPTGDLNLGATTMTNTKAQALAAAAKLAADAAQALEAAHALPDVSAAAPATVAAPAPAPAPAPVAAAPAPAPAPAAAPAPEHVAAANAAIAQVTGAEAEPKNAALAIAELCTLRGCKEMTADYIMQHAAGQITVAGLRKKFMDERAVETNHPDRRTSGSHTGGSGSNGSAMDQMEQMAVNISENSAGRITKAAAYEQVMRTRPDLYLAYQAEKDAALSSRNGTAEYVRNMQAKFPGMGLGVN